jgi:hypothetical protein
MSAAGSENWNSIEIDLIVADYFAMLDLEAQGTPYVKAQRNRALQAATGRSRGSIEFKHENISAVMMHLGMRWISGYKPMANYQDALIDGIARFLGKHPEWWTGDKLPSLVSNGSLAAEPKVSLWIGPPPSFKQRGKSDSPPLRRLLAHFDPASRDERNRTLGNAGEERVYHHELARLRDEGRADLARRVRWVSAEDGDGAGYDILSFTADGHERLIEVKTTNGYELTPFHISRNECALASERPDAFRLLRLYNFARDARAFELTPPLDQHVQLTPTNFLASFS